MSKFLIGGITVAAVLLVGTIGFFSTTTRVEPGFDAIIYNQYGGLEQRVLPAGRHALLPWETAYQYPTSTETIYLSKSGKEGAKDDESFNVKTSDGKTVNIDAVYSYHFDGSKLPDIYAKYRGQNHESIENGIIRQKVQQVAQEVLSSYDVFDTFKKTQDINKQFYDGLKKQFDNSGIVIESGALKRIEPDKATEDAIQTQVNSEMAIKTKELEKQQVEIDADKQRIQAQGVADSKVISAQGDAKANAALQQSITDELIRYTLAQAQAKVADKWDGKLPSVQAGNSGTILQLPTPPSTTPSK